MPQETDLDALLRSDDPTDDSSQDQQQDDGKEPDKSSQEEVEFNKLRGTAQDRIRQLVREKNQLKAEAEKARALAYKPTLPPAPPANPDFVQAKKTLADAGIMTDEKFEQRMAEREARIRYEDKIRQLTQVENGDDGRPRFDKEEYEDYVRSNPQYQYYDPQDVFGIMYRQELTDWEWKHRNQPSGASPLKNAKTFRGDDVWTPEYINEHALEPGWYDKNIEKINRVMDASQRS